MPTWNEVTEANPAHSENYARKWKTLEAQGHDIYGEARLVDAIVERGSRILDAGCGQGRLGGYLLKQGHTVVGVDIDPILIEYARADHPKGTWLVGDLSADPIPEGNFDMVFSAGNVMGFLAPHGREPALGHLFAALRPGGRALIGFGKGRGWEFDDFLSTASSVGFTRDAIFSGWDLTPFTESSTFLVALLTRPTPGGSLLA